MRITSDRRPWNLDSVDRSRLASLCLTAVAALLLSCSQSSGGANDGGGQPCGACVDAGSGAMPGSDGSLDATIDATTMADVDMTEASGDDGSSDSPSEADVATSEASLEAGDANAAGAVASLCTSSCPTAETMCQGSCVSAADPAHGCGAPSCQACVLAHAQPGCGAQGCAVATCETGWADCNGNPADGCEADLSKPETCMACNVQCAPPTGLCAPTGCVAACPAQLTPCATADAGTGAGTDAGTDAGRDAGADSATDSGTDAATDAGTNAGSASGSCVDLTNSPENCGTCGKACGLGNATAGNRFAVCTAGACATSCFAGTTNCGSACLDTARNPMACGTCTNSCPPASNGFATCSASQCGLACAPGWTLCKNACVTMQTDPSNCGGCGLVCPSNEICAAGTCRALPSVWVATGVASVQEMAVDATGVYWTDLEGHVLSVPLAGGAVATLAQGQARPWGIALDGSYVYWSNNQGGAILRAPKDGTGSPTLVATATSPGDIGIYGANVYWIDQSPNVWMSAKDGGGSPDGGGAPEGGAADGGPAGGGGGRAVARTVGVGNVALLANQNGVFVENTSAAKAGVYGVTGGWFARSMATAAGFVDDGSRLFLQEELDPQHCQLAAVAETDGALGTVFSAPCPVTPLAANGCGVFYLGTAQLSVARTGGVTGAPVLKLPVQHAAIYGSDLYFYSIQAIGRVPLP